MRCISCGAEMRIARIEQDPAMKAAGYEYQKVGMHLLPENGATSRLQWWERIVAS